MSHTERVQAALAERASGFPLIDGGRPAFWPFGELTAAQMRERAKLEYRLNAGVLPQPQQVAR